MDGNNSVLFYGEDEIAELEEEEEENDRVDTDAQLLSSINKISLMSHPSPKYTGYSMPQKSCLKSAAKRKNLIAFAYTTFFYKEYGIVNPEAFILQNGTKTNLFVTFVNTQHPERNGGMYECNITYVQ
eukprot:14509803-Ditylum_brightwellii.AAC.1